MNKKALFSREKGFVLIFAIWVLGFLTILAVGIAAGIRQKIVLLEKLDQRDRFCHLLDASVKYSMLYISSQLSSSNWVYTPIVKKNLHNNPVDLGQYSLGDDRADIIYTLAEQGELFGVVDEERKINLNFTTADVLSALIEKVLGLKVEDAQKLARALLDCRQYGESEVKGFFSDEYYSNLNEPYVKKDGNYEILDEILLVKGMTKEWYEKLIDYVTIYGDGKININTASGEVLSSLGLDDAVIEKIFEARQGRDKIEATIDDHIFQKTFDIATETKSFTKLLPAEIRSIDSLSQRNLLTTTSYFFTARIKGHLAHNTFVKSIRCVISARENKIVYWQER